MSNSDSSGQPVLQIVITMGQSLSVGATANAGILSTRPVYPNNVLALNFGASATINDGWGSSPVVASKFQGFTPLYEVNSESPVSSMLNAVVADALAAGKPAPTLLNINTGTGGLSILQLMTSSGQIYGSLVDALSNTAIGQEFAVQNADGTYGFYLRTASGDQFYENLPGPIVYFDNLVKELTIAVNYARTQGYQVSPNVIFNYEQGQADTDIGTGSTGYDLLLPQLLQRVQTAAQGVIGPDATVDNVITQVRGYSSKDVSIDQLNATETVPNTIFGAPEYEFEAEYPSKIGTDYTHLSPTGYYMLGQELGNKIFDLLQGKLDQPILIERVTKPSSNTLFIGFSGVNTYLVNDPSPWRSSNLLTAPPNLGFGAYGANGNAPTAISITGASIVASNVVQLTFSGAISGAFRLYLGRTQNDPLTGGGLAGFGGATLRDASETAALPPPNGQALPDPYVYDYAPIQYVNVATGSVDVADATALQADGEPVYILGSATVSDTAANLSLLTAAQIGALAALGFTNLVSTSGNVALTAVQAQALELASWTVSVPAKGTVTLTDTAAAIDGLSPGVIAALPKIGVRGVGVTGTGATLTVSQAQSIEAAGLSLAAPAGTSNSISDSAVNVESLTAAQIAGLPALHVSRIVVTGAGLSLTSAQLNAIGTADISIAYSLTVADALALSAAQLRAVQGGVAIIDLSTAVQAGLDQLEALAAQGLITSINLTDAGPAALSITAGQLIADQGALNLIGGAFQLTVSGPLSVGQILGLPPALLARTDGATIADTAADVGAGLDALQGLVARGGVTAISLTDAGTPTIAITAGQFGADLGALGLITGPFQLTVSGPVSIAAALAVPAPLLIDLQGGLTLFDTAAAVTADLDALQALVTQGAVASITLIDSGVPTVTPDASQFSADIDALSLISGVFHISVIGSVDVDVAVSATPAVLAKVQGGVSVSDTAANVQAGLDKLEALAAQGLVASISLTVAGPATLSITAGQLVADQGALNLIGGAFQLTVSGPLTVGQILGLPPALLARIDGATIADTAADVGAGLDALQGLMARGGVTAISLTGAGTPTIAITAGQLGADLGALGLIAGPFQLTVSGAASVAGALAVPGPLLAKLQGGLAVADFAAAVATNLDALQALVAQDEISAITLTDSGSPTLNISAAQLFSDAQTLGLIGDSFGLNVSGVTVAEIPTVVGHGWLRNVGVADTAANIQAGLDSLEALAALGLVASISLTDAGPAILSITAGQLVADQGALNLIGGAFQLTISGPLTAGQLLGLTPALLARIEGATIADTAADVGASLDALQGLVARGGVTTISLTDAGTPTLAITAGQLGADQGALGLIAGPFQLTVSGAASVAGALAVPAALFARLQGELAISDTAAAVATNLDALQALVTQDEIGAITLTDGGSPTLTISAAQLVSDAQTLGLIGDSFGLNVSGVTVAEIPMMVGQGRLRSVGVADTAANVQAGLDRLETLAAQGLVASISLTDAGPPTLSITAGQLAADQSALDLIGGAFQLTVSGPLTVGQLLTLPPALLSRIGGATIADTAADVGASLDVLQGLVARGGVTTISLTDAGTPTLAITAGQLGADQGALGLIAGPFQLTVSGAASVAGALAVPAALFARLQGELAISDTAAAVDTNLDALQALVAQGEIGAITLTDGGSPTLNISAAQLSNDAATLLDIRSSFRIVITGAVSATTAVAASPTLIAKLATPLAVSDTAAQITATLNGLQTLSSAGAIGSVAVSDQGVVGLSYGQLSGAAALLSRFTGVYGLSIASAPASKATSLLATPHVVLVGVADTAANVLANLPSLQTAASGGHISSIALTDASTPTLSLQAAALASNSTALNLITSAFKITASGVIGASLAASLPAGIATRLTTGLAISDTGAAVASTLNGLQALNAEGGLSSITLTDSSAPKLSLTAAQFAADAATLAKIKSAFSVAATGSTTAASLVGVSTSVLAKLTSGLTVADSGAGVQANLTWLQYLTANSFVSSIVLTDGVLPVTASQLGDAATLGKIGGGANLVLQGAGAFNLGSIAILPTFSTVTVFEGQAGSGAIASTLQAITLRSGYTTTIDVESPQAPNAANPNPASITIIGAGDSDTINLGAGADTVTLGSAAETVHGGSGADIINATAATAGALITGATGAETLNLTGGGAATMNAADSGIGAVVLRPSATAYAFTANAEAGLVITDSSGAADTVTAGGPGETVTGGAAGKLTVVGASFGGTVIRDTSSLLNGDSIMNFAPTTSAGDVIDLTDISFARLTSETFVENAARTSGQLKLSDGVHTATITLFGQYAAAGFSGIAAAAGFTISSDGSVGTSVTHAVAVPH
jgi:hypothetical protein